MYLRFKAVRSRAAHNKAWAFALALLVVFFAGGPPAKADDTAAWFGEVYKGTNLGLTAGVMRLGARPSEHRRARRSGHKARYASLVRDDAGLLQDRPREKRAAKSRRSRRTRVASLGNDFAPQRARETRRHRAKHGARRRTRVASLGGGYAPSPSPSLSGGHIRWAANAGCLNGHLRSVVASIAASFGAVTVNSTCRSRRHNRRVGGARHSHHLTGNAVDFRVHGNWRSVWSYLRNGAGVGGVKHYGRGLFHIDMGPRRTW